MPNGKAGLSWGMPSFSHLSKLLVTHLQSSYVYNILAVKTCVDYYTPPSPLSIWDKLDGKSYIEDPNFKGCRAFLIYLILPKKIQKKKLPKALTDHMLPTLT